MTSSLSLQQFRELSYNDLDQHLDREFHPAQLDAAQVPHPKSGFMVSAGLARQPARPDPGPEGPAVFNVRDHGDPLQPGYNSLKYAGGRHVGQEPIQHVYRGMSDEEWSQAQQRGYIQSDQRGTIAGWEGTNAAVDPQSAVSYLPRGGASHVAKIRVEPQDQWFNHTADSYVRTRQPIPLDRVEHVIPMNKSEKGYLSVPQFGGS